MKTIDCTPTWEGLLPLMLDAYCSQKKKGNIADLQKEFTRMAAAADKWNAYVKSQKEQQPDS